MNRVHEKRRLFSSIPGRFRFVLRPLLEPSSFTAPVPAYAAGLLAGGLTRAVGLLRTGEFPALTFLPSSTTAAVRSTPTNPNPASANKAIIRIGMACTSVHILEC